MVEEIPIKKYTHTSYDKWPGKVSAVILLGGCNFRCHFCNTPELVSNWRKLPDLKFSEVLEHLKSRRNWIDGVVISGGEPSIHKADVIEILNELKAEGFDTKVETNGFDPDFIAELNKLKLVDFWAVDIKASFDMYKKATDIDTNPETIRKSIKLVIESEIDYEFTTTVVPGLHDKFQIFKLARELEGAKKYVIQNFKPGTTLNPTWKDIKPFTEKQLIDMAEQAKQFVKVVEIR
jgi:pyruvate formate lyase activating enzyme